MEHLNIPWPAVIVLVWVVLVVLGRQAARRKRAAPSDASMARLEAAAQKILREKASASSMGAGSSPAAGQRAPRPGRPAKPVLAKAPKPVLAKAPKPVLARSANAAPQTMPPRRRYEPAIQRRTGFLAGGHEPVIQRCR